MKTRLMRVMGIMGVMCALSLAAQTTTTINTPMGTPGGTLYQKNADGSFSPITLNTNETGVPFLSGPAMDIFHALTTATNWGAAAFGIYQPASANHKARIGTGAVFLYNVSQYVGAGLGIDYMDNNVTMPSGQIQLQAPLRIGGTNGLEVTPFGFTGIATPLSGENNGSVVGIFGAGINFTVYKGVGVFGAIEQRTGQDKPWYLAGLSIKRF